LEEENVLPKDVVLSLLPNLKGALLVFDPNAGVENWVFGASVF